MKLSYIRLTALFACVGFLMLSGCQEQARQSQEPQPVITEPAPPAVGQQSPKPEIVEAAKAQVGKKGPQIRFDKIVHDFGEVGPTTFNECEFALTNVGEGVLKISRVHPPCGCTVADLPKKEYKPGESGTLKVTYHSASLAGSPRKFVYVYSNDTATPKVTLTMTAKITPKVAYEPQRLNLLLKDKPEVPEITLTSIDGQPFSIQSFGAPANSITADIDPSVKATKFVIKPKVDPARLRRGLNGVVEISLTHPQCKTISIPFNALAKFKLNPPVLILWNAEPGKPIARDVWVLNNYEEDFTIESAKSNNDYVKVLAQEKVSNGYKFRLEVTPPPAEDSARFTDVLFVKVKDGEKLGITCRGFYAMEKTSKAQ